MSQDLRVVIPEQELLEHVSFMCTFAAILAPEHYAVHLKLAEDVIPHLPEDQRENAKNMLTTIASMQDRVEFLFNRGMQPSEP
jgi:hypothetical protein